MKNGTGLTVAVVLSSGATNVAATARATGSSSEAAKIECDVARTPLAAAHPTKASTNQTFRSGIFCGKLRSGSPHLLEDPQLFVR